MAHARVAIITALVNPAAYVCRMNALKLAPGQLYKALRSYSFIFLAPRLNILHLDSRHFEVCANATVLR